MRKKNEESETVNITRVRDGEVLFTLTMDKDYFGIIEGAKMPVRFTKEGPGGTGVWTVFIMTMNRTPHYLLASQKKQKFV